MPLNNNRANRTDQTEKKQTDRKSWRRRLLS